MGDVLQRCKFFGAERKGINGYLDSEKSRHKQDLTPSTVTTLSITPELAAPIVVPRAPSQRADHRHRSLCTYRLVATSTALFLFLYRRAAPDPCLCAHAALVPYPSPCPSLHDVRLCGRTHAPCHDVRRLHACCFVRSCSSVLVLEKKRDKAGSREYF